MPLAITGNWVLSIQPETVHDMDQHKPKAAASALVLDRTLNRGYKSIAAITWFIFGHEIRRQRRRRERSEGTNKAARLDGIGTLQGGAYHFRKMTTQRVTLSINHHVPRMDLHCCLGRHGRWAAIGAKLGTHLCITSSFASTGVRRPSGINNTQKVTNCSLRSQYRALNLPQGCNRILS